MRAQQQQQLQPFLLLALLFAAAAGAVLIFGASPAGFGSRLAAPSDTTTTIKPSTTVCCLRSPLYPERIPKSECKSERGSEFTASILADEACENVCCERPPEAGSFSAFRFDVMSRYNCRKLGYEWPLSDCAKACCKYQDKYVVLPQGGVCRKYGGEIQADFKNCDENGETERKFCCRRPDENGDPAYELTYLDSCMISGGALVDPSFCQ
jgi:hypothetical protein